MPCYVSSALLLTLAVSFDLLLSVSTLEFIHISLSNPVVLISGVVGGLVLSIVLTIPFMILKSTVARRAGTSRIQILWMMSPALLFIALIVSHAFWKCLPEQRLRSIARLDISDARDIKTTGVSSFLAGSWLAIFIMDESSFLDYCNEKQLEQNQSFAMLDSIRKNSVIRSSRLMDSLPEQRSGVLQYEERSENGRAGLYAIYDLYTGSMVIYTYYHD